MFDFERYNNNKETNIVGTGSVVRDDRARGLMLIGRIKREEFQ